MAKGENLLDTLTLKAQKPANKGVVLKDGGGLRGRVLADSNGNVSVLFNYQYRSPESGKLREPSCGTWPDVSLSEIRNTRNHLRTIVASGIDPLEEKVRERNAALAEQLAAEQKKLQDEAVAAEQQRQQDEALRIAKQEAAAPTMQDLFEQWDASHGMTLEPHWQVVRRSHWRCHAQPFIGTQKIAAASKPDLMKHYDQMIQEGKTVTANRVLALVRQVMQWGIERGLVNEGHSLATMNPPKARKTVKAEQQPENFDAAVYIAKHGTAVIGEDGEDGKSGRALQFAELSELLGEKLSLSSQSETGKCVIRFMLATGVRASQALRLRWKWVLLDQRVIIFPAGSMKAKKMHHVHLSDYAIKVLEKMSAIRLNEFVFPAPIKANSAVRRDNVGNDIASRQFYRDDEQSESAYQARMAKRMECRRTRADFNRYNLSGGKWTLYDLRRTAATRLCELTGSDWDTIQRVLAHADPHGVTGKYVRFSKWADRCNALDLLGKALADCEAGLSPAQSTANIIPLRSA